MCDSFPGLARHLYCLGAAQLTLNAALAFISSLGDDTRDVDIEKSFNTIVTVNIFIDQKKSFNTIATVNILIDQK